MQQTVQPPLKFLPPRLTPWVVRFAQTGLPLWLRWAKGIPRIEVEGGERLAQLYQQFEAGKIRLLVAFRHPTLDDPPCLMYLFSHLLPRVARQEGIRLRQRPHVLFVYDRGLPLWLGSIARWGLPRLGGIPILRGRLDRAGLKSSREQFVSGQYPLAVAPEGTINGMSGLLNPLEPGVAQMGFWAVEDLHKAGRPEEVLILPVGIRYSYLRDPSPVLDRLLHRMEADCKLPATRSAHVGKGFLMARLLRLAEHLIQVMERFYERFYAPALPDAARVNLRGGGDLLARLQSLSDLALRVAEQHFGLQPQGDLIERRHRIEQAGWAWIYREDIADIAALSALEKGLANRVASEAGFHLWHMRLVETLMVFAVRPLPEQPSLEELAETALRLWNLLAWIKGKNPVGADPPRLGPRLARFSIGDPLSVSERWPAYQANRRQAVQALTQDLQAEMERLLHGIPRSPAAMAAR
ncbi:1-acyl-sn-glycerol-3-phosphate acyltransferase [Synechococcus sp. H55.7]|uniref:1-acyl-sn-glycerol-3-phosphate acyltransferase n=1 Tax=unclassified Synechococcus TaxID=2626047 RepID=UPI0039C406F3